MLSVSIKTATTSTWKIRIFRGVARIFQLGGGGGGFPLCHTQGTYQIGMSTSRRFSTKRDIFFDEQWAWEKGQAYKIAAQINYVPRRINYSILVYTWSTADVRSCKWSKQLSRTGKDSLYVDSSDSRVLAS